METDTVEKLNSLLMSKIEKLSNLKKIRESTEKNYETYKQSKVASSLSRGYLFFKRFFLLIFGLLMLIFGVIFFVFPEITIADENFKAQILEAYKEEFSSQVGTGLLESIHILSNEYSETGAYDLIEALELSIDRLIEKELIETFRFFSLLIILSSLIILYISKQSKKLNSKYSELKKARLNTQSTLDELTNMIDVEQNELELLRQLLPNHNVESERNV